MEVRGTVRISLQYLVRNWNFETIAELFEVVEGQLLHLVGRVAACEVSPKIITFNSAGKHHCRCPLELRSRLIGVVDLAVVMATTAQRPDLLISPVFDHFGSARVATEEVLTNIGTVVGLEGLVVTITSVVHDVNEGTVAVGLQQRVPAGSPNNLDDVPASATEDSLKFLNNLAVATHRSVQTLQVAVDDEGEVVELFIGSNLQESARLRLVHLAITEEGPHMLIRAVLDATVGEVFVHGRLVDGIHRAQAHRHRRKLPEVGQHAGVRVGR